RSDGRLRAGRSSAAPSRAGPLLMAPRPPLQVNYGRAFYLAMLALGLTAFALMFVMVTSGMKPALTVPGTDAQADNSLMYFAGAAVVFCMGYYMWRAFDRLRNPGPVIEVRSEGVMLRIREDRRYPWS